MSREGSFSLWLNPTNLRASAATLIMFIVGLVFDFFTPLGVAGGIIYVIFILSALRYPWPYTSFVFAVISTVLTIIGYFLITEIKSDPWIVQFNRGLSILALWSVAIAIYFQKKTENSLLVNETRLQSVLDTVNTVIVSVTEEGTIETFNEAAERVFGYDMEEVKGKNIKVLMPEKYKNHHDEYLKKYSETGKKSIFGAGRELTGLRKNGEEFPLMLHVGEVNLESRRIFTGAIEDLSVLKQAQKTERDIREALENEKQRLEEQDWVQRAFTQLTVKLQAKTDVEDFARELLNGLLPLLDAQLGLFYFVYRKQGERSVLRCQGTYGYSDAKELQRDIQLGEGLVGQAAETKQPIYLNQIPSDYIHNIGSGLGNAKPTQVSIMPIVFEGRTLAVLEVASLSCFTSQHQALLKQTLHSCVIIVNGIVSILRTEELLSQVQNQTEQLKQSEEELRVSNEELARQSVEVEERNRQLEETQVELEETSAYKSEFLANMSHELRTPLNSLLILSRMLLDNKEGNLNHNQVKSASIIYHSGNDLMKLINDILDLSKVEAGQMTVTLEPLSFAQISTEVEKSFASVAEEKGIGFSITLDSTLPETMTTDEQRLIQILRNLLSNAFKFIKEGSVSLHISRVGENTHFSRNELRENGAIAFAVKDTGIGIPEEKQNIIFDAFQQIDARIQREYGGTGLGLSICRQLADLLNGEIHLDSVEGEGSIFTLYLPEKCEKSVPTHRIKTSLSRSEKSNRLARTVVPDDRDSLSSDKQTILLLEDDPNFAMIVASLVREHGFNILISDDGGEGYMLAKEFRPIGIIVDLTLSGVSGQTAISRLKDSSSTRHIPVHVMSGTGSIEEVKDKGVIGFLQKPVSQEKIVSVLTRFSQLAEKPIKKLLLVEDDEVQSDYIRDLLGNHDMEVITAETAFEAEKHLESEDIDCMVLDLNLPDTDGLKLLRLVHVNEKLDNLPIIVYTAKDLQKDELVELNQYAHAVIQKSEKGAEKLLDEVALFLHRMEANLPDKQRQILQKMHDVEAILNHKKVLLVDDDMRNIYALSAGLEGKNMKIVVAKNGEEALEQLVENADIDIVLMDIMMPKMDGYEAIRRIREDNNQYKNVPIIALTAKAMTNDREKCIEAGANDYISKPIEIERLFSLMRVWLY